MGRHSVARRRRIPSAIPAAAVIAPYALLLATSGDVSVPAPGSEAAAPDQVVDDAAARSIEVAASPPPDFSAAASVEAVATAAPVQFSAASSYRVYNREA